MPSRKPNRRYGNAPRSQQFDIPRRPKENGASSFRDRGDYNGQAERLEAVRAANSIDESLGFQRYDAGKKRVGWLCNMHSTTIEDEKISQGKAGVDFYFIEDDGNTFKATMCYDPYFLIAARKGKESQVEGWCRRKFEGLIKTVKRLEKEDLQLPNHLLGHRRAYLQLAFHNVPDLLAVRRELLPVAEKNRRTSNERDVYFEGEASDLAQGFDIFQDADRPLADPNNDRILDASDFIIDIREYDVPYHVRVAIDQDIRIGKWYNVEAKHGVTSLTCIDERITRADPVVLAFDIETTKLPLKFPDAVIDQIMMISYMIDGQGFLITNREIISEDIADFDYTPKPEYEGPFLVFNEPNEKAVLERFFLHIQEARPTVIATFNGDFFDWPFVEARSNVLGIDMYQEIGFRKNSEDVYQSDCCAHMDCFAWVNRDSYLPQGSRGLKAVTVAKLGYDPDELDPELMTPYAREKPQVLAEYSVSDAVATYYLYMKYIHPFIFSLCNIIPLGPDDVLRKGTGTLCEMLLMVQAFKTNIILPNKHKDPRESFWDGHLLESETYVGGHVESIEAGVFRSDIPVNFAIDTVAIDELIRDLDSALQFSITVEEKKSTDDIMNYDEVKREIIAKLEDLKSTPNRKERPSIYHLDVASMYPNIMTTNRLQPDSMIEESDCAACDFNRPGKTCDRRLPWSWRGEYLPPQRSEYNMVRRALENERFPGRTSNAPSLSFRDMTEEQQANMVKKRLIDYSKKIYHKIHETETVEREAIICQRENPFYVNTVRKFRDRRYDFKGQQKIWKGKTESLKSSGASAIEIDEAKKMIVLFDSLQLAHKVILNSFYGYVMRKGSRWYSMEMAGVTCLTGAHIIQMARELVERIGRPLELDTDGIWCMLPATFPENVVFNLKNGKKMAISYPCTMLNHLVHGKFTNHQYQELVDQKTFRYETHSDNTIFFEVDGPYKAMILPASKEADKNLKKRYAVFNHDGSLAELKGFEVKRRGELKLIKTFQQQIFKFFLEGESLAETYAAVAKVANRWLDVLHERGRNMNDEDLIDLICENRSMSKTLEEYGAQKSTSITTAKRLSEFLGLQMVKDKGLNCKYIIAAKPKNAPVTERAIPTTIFSAEEHVKRYYLRKWLREEPVDMNPRALIDWDYYLERLGSVVQKLISIPAALQRIANPVPRVKHPDWLQHRLNTMGDKMRQKKMTDLLHRKPLAEVTPNLLEHRLHTDLEDPNAMAKATTVAAKDTQPAQERLVPNTSPNADPTNRLPPKMPQATEDYEGFLSFQKRKWALQKQARRRRRQLFGERSTTSSDALRGFFRNQAELVYSNTWHLLELRDSDSPGSLRAFVLINGTIHILTINVPRQFYLNLKENRLPDIEIRGCHVDKVTHSLPNGHSSVHLFKMTMPEQTYLDKRQKLDALCNHPSVEGIYENQVPASIRAVLDLGSLCTFDETRQGVLGRGLEHGFGLGDLVKPSAPVEYLHGAELSATFVYHLEVADRQAVFLITTEKSDARLFIYDRQGDGQGFPSCEKAYAEALERQSKRDPAHAGEKVIKYQDTITCSTTHSRTKRKFFREISDALKKLRNDEAKSTILCLHSTHQRLLYTEIASLGDFPVLKLKSDASNRKPPSLGWQSFFVKRCISQYLELDSTLQHYIGLAKYGDIPFCNFERDDACFLVDVAYARRLQKNNVILWWSDGPLPDHGGHEKDRISAAPDATSIPVINHPGTYSSVCIEIEVRNLAINTILTSILINEAEGADPVASKVAQSFSGQDSDESFLASEHSFASANIAVLRDMVKAWWMEACKGNSMADVMVQHLVRWVESPNAYLYDPSLRNYVHMMSRKAYQHFINEFRRVGSHLVFASTGRLLLQTTKAEVGNAYAYSHYILKTIQTKPMFHFLDLNIKEYWDYLVWDDQFNYGGKACHEVVEAEQQNIQTVVHWQLASFLPRQYQEIFNDWIVEFIDVGYQTKHPLTGPNDNGSEWTPRPTQLPTPPDADEETSNQKAILLASSIFRPLKKQVLSLIARYREEISHPDLASDLAFPVLPGSRSNHSNSHPVLEFVKSIVHVFSLDRSLTLDIRRLRAELLKMFEIKEFSAQGLWTNPSFSYKLGNVICEVCTFSREFDLCRDEDLMPEMLPVANGPSHGGPVAKQRLWQCPTCHFPYDRLTIEEKLIARLQRILAEWQTQDLKCKKCKMLRVNELMEHCSCGGEWLETLHKDELSEELRILGHLANVYELRMLRGVLDDTLGLV